MCLCACTHARMCSIFVCVRISYSLNYRGNFTLNVDDNILRWESALHEINRWKHESLQSLSLLAGHLEVNTYNLKISNALNREILTHYGAEKNFRFQSVLDFIFFIRDA